MGIIPVNKPCGWTSFDVCAKLRGLLKIKRVGHGGTLDPMATGVLPVFVGKATKACDILPEKPKLYTACFELGLSTDTQDISGEVIERSEKKASREQLEAAAKGFVGEIMQLPPMYSAVKVDGKRLYELAREGKSVERQAKRRRIDFINITDFDEQTQAGKMDVSVSKGTYVRTLIDDIGRSLGTLAVMTALERTSACGFDTKQCFSIGQLEKMSEENTLERAVMPLERAFDYPSLILSECQTKLYKNGVKLRAQQLEISRAEQTYCIFDSEKIFIAIARLDTAKGELRSVKNFY